MKKKLYDLFLALNALSFLLYILTICKYYKELYKHTDGKLILFLLVIGFINSIIMIKTKDANGKEPTYLLLGKRKD